MSTPAQPEAPTFRPQVIPSLMVQAVEPLRDFYIGKLGFEHMMGIVGKDGAFDFCIVTRDGNGVMIGRPEKPEAAVSLQSNVPRSLELYIYVENVDRYHAEITGRGVAVVDALQTQWWGDRTFAVKDPYGYQIWFCQPTGEFSPPEGVKVI
ncbi:VOC family protein [Pendulispora albinea]|uniref:VOC family protein n=1 Tax=Pendulispora albinea TaxID=2741071 RepID=A0ABZ2LWX9_9BACT